MSSLRSENGWARSHRFHFLELIIVDHHCAWLASKCIVSVPPRYVYIKHNFYIQGHRTYPAFLHFLCTITLLAGYIAIISARAVWFAFNNPYSIVSILDLLTSTYTRFYSNRMMSYLFMNYFSPSLAFCFL